MWITIDKKLMVADRNVLLGTVYISPINSSVYNRINREVNYNNIFDELCKQVASFDENDDIILGGDFNARTGNLNDFIENENEKNIFAPFTGFYDKESTFYRVRVNQDRKVNQFGRELRDFSIATNLKILNGRTLGDFTGKYTCIKSNGCSTVDYVLASQNILIEQKRYDYKF